MTLHVPFDNSYAALPEGFFVRLDPQPVREPRLLAWNDALAQELGISADPGEAAEVFAGNRVPEGAAPLAQAYAGHQFGGFSPQLGDGRAILLGEVIDRQGIRRDIQLKGSGRTPFSRGGDGRAWLGPVLREYLVSEAMHAMGVPTTRALAAVATGETVYRETALPGAVLTRVAASHLRVGTFEFYAARRDGLRLQHLLDYAIQRHDPQAEGPLAFLEGVIDRQARLVAHWMTVGFIHGVMNTDNTSISGETIDYGPCAFMDAFHPSCVYSSIDRHGRYAYDQQAQVIVWNMAQLASAVLAIDPRGEAALEDYTAAVHAMPDKIRAEWLRRFGQKLGIAEPTEEDGPLIDDLLALMANQSADFTNTFRGLSDAQGDAARALFTDPAPFDAWRTRWRERIETENEPAARMGQTNPALIPRNHRIEQAIRAAVAGDLAPFERLHRALATPFELAEADADLALPPKPEEEVQATFCGT